MTHQRNDNNPNPKDEMRTPPWLFNLLNEKYNFTIDAACAEGNCLCPYGFYWDAHSKEDPEGRPLDALVRNWRAQYDHDGKFIEPRIYLNPPYGKGKIEPFIKKAVYEADLGATVVMLLPVDMSTKWWDYMMFANEWWRIPFRVHFYGIDGNPMKGSPWFDSIVAVFKPVHLAYQPTIRTLEVPVNVMADLRRRKKK